MYTAAWQSEVYSHAHFSDSDDPDLDADGADGNPFNRNEAFKRAKARQLAAQRRRGRQQALLASQSFGRGSGGGKHRPKSAVAHAGQLPEVFVASAEAALRKGQEAREAEEAAAAAALRMKRAEQEAEEDAARSREVEEATGSPRRRLDRDAARRIQKYLEHESPQLRRSIDESMSRPTDLIAFHAARREAKRRQRQHRTVQRTFKNALNAGVASAMMQARAAKAARRREEGERGTAAGGGGEEAQQAMPGLQRLNHGGIRAAVSTLLAQAKFMNLRLNLPSAGAVVGNDPDDPLTNEDLDAPVGDATHVWGDGGSHGDRPEDSSGADSDAEAAAAAAEAARLRENEEERRAREEAEAERARLREQELAAKEAARRRAPSFVQPIWKPIKSVQHSYGMARLTNPHQQDYFGNLPGVGTPGATGTRRARPFPYYGVSTTTQRTGSNQGVRAAVGASAGGSRTGSAAGAGLRAVRAAATAGRRPASVSGSRSRRRPT